MIEIYSPKSTILKKYVDFFYYINTKNTGELNYVVFPHTFTTISLFKGAELSRGNHKVTIYSNKESTNKHNAEITGRFIKPFFINYLSHIEEITIIFKPLGVNVFLRNNFIDYAPLYSQALNQKEWISICKDAFDENRVSKRIEKIERWLLSNLNEKENVAIKKAITLIENANKDYSLQEIADLCKISTKSLQRGFYKHLGCSPISYKRIARFRHSLTKDVLKGEIKKLTDVAHDSNYYDQSYFIKEYKRLTGTSPKNFFNRIIKLHENKIILELK
jgi:AraC-like DNA-binding protein